VRSVHRGLRWQVVVVQQPKTALVDDDVQQTIGAIDLASPGRSRLRTGRAGQ
jgi:hypothetical protein